MPQIDDDIYGKIWMAIREMIPGNIGGLPCQGSLVECGQQSRSIEPWFGVRAYILYWWVWTQDPSLFPLAWPWHGGLPMIKLQYHFEYGRSAYSLYIQPPWYTYLPWVVYILAIDLPTVLFILHSHIRLLWHLLSQISCIGCCLRTT